MQSTKGNPTYVWLFLIGLMTLTAVNAIKCLQCKSDENIDCLDQNKIEVTDCKGGETKCYTYNANGIITRGCYDDTKCELEENKCIPCTADGCNKEAICKTCESSDSDCSQSNASDTKYNGICKSSDTKCFMNVKDKKVERRCAVDGDSCTDSTTCKLCTGANCNAGIFPANRRQCFQCTDSKCDTAVSNKNNAKPCLNYVADDKCYTTGTKADAMTRGCLSDVDPKPCSQDTDKGCYACGTDSCNNSTYKRDAKMSCIKCDATADCAAEREADKAEPCKEQLLYNQTESCYIRTKDSTVKRGCLYDDAKDECESCDVCSDKNGCNNRKVDITFTCIVCRSDANKGCWNHAKDIGGQRCENNETSKEDGCFHGVWNGIAIRGCYIDADERMKVTCKEDKNNQCTVCNEKDCNTKETSGASSITISFSLLAVILATFCYLN